MMRHEVNLYRLWIGILFCLVKATLARNVDMFKTYLYSPSLEPYYCRNFDRLFKRNRC